MRDVLITRGRGGAGWKKPGRQLPLEDRPSREPMDRRGTKFFDDHLGPLKRFLASRVGRRWDDVWSELCAGLDRRGLLQEHVFVHLLEMVAVQVVRRDGAWWVTDRRGVRPLRSGRWRSRFYVDPVSGRLERAPP
jgi:hypothetical protein